MPSPIEDSLAAPEPTSSTTEDDLAVTEPTSSPTEDYIPTLEPTLQPTGADETLTLTLQSDSPTKQPPIEARNSTTNPPLLCTDTPNWEDTTGDVYELCETNDFPGCPIFRNSYE